MPHLARLERTRPSYPTIVFAGPIESLLRKLDADISTLRDITPGAAELRVLERQAEALRSALEEATRTDCILTVESVAHVEKVTEQAIRKRLEKGQYPGAEKRGGVWRIPQTALGRAA